MLLIYFMTLPPNFLHSFFEFLGYFVAGRIYFYTTKKNVTPYSDRGELTKAIILAGAVLGAISGAILAHMIENFSIYKQSIMTGVWPIPGKSILGGLLGGILGTEIAKKLRSFDKSTGDLWIVPIFVGLAIGRIGCQLTGLEDTTYGKPTLADWGWNYGDGVLRYPVAIIESVCVVLIGLMTLRIRTSIAGLKFNVFMLGYCLFRFFIEYFKPPFGVVAKTEKYQPDLFFNVISGLQLVALLGAFWMIFRIVRSFKNGKK